MKHQIAITRSQAHAFAEADSKDLDANIVVHVGGRVRRARTNAICTALKIIRHTDAEISRPKSEVDLMSIHVVASEEALLPSNDPRSPSGYLLRWDVTEEEPVIDWRLPEKKAFPVLYREDEMTGDHVLVPRRTLCRWAHDWAAENDPGDGTDIITPFDEYLYPRPTDTSLIAAIRHQMTVDVINLMPDLITDEAIARVTAALREQVKTDGSIKS